jgi:hypothetical protein
MRPVPFVLFLAITGAAFHGANHVATAASDPTIAQVAWLTGCWERTTPRATVEERWMPPRGRNMVEVGRTMRGDSLVDYELVVLREQGAHLAYEAHPANQPPATFLSSTVSDTGVVFANEAHDFPQRVGYRRGGADSLFAWIEGRQGEQTRRVNFAYHRVPCG